jgi:hypothetical protein
MRNRALSYLFGLGAMILPASFSGAQVISVDWYGGGGGGGTTQEVMGPTESAGVVPRTNWNSLTPNTQAAPQTLITDTGSAGGNVVWTSANTWNVGHVQAPGDLRMMKGYIDTNDTSITTVTVAGLPSSITSAPYSVIVYTDGDNGTQARVGRYSIGDQVLWTRDAGGAFTGVYSQGQTSIDPLPGATGTGLDNQGVAAGAVPAGNYLIFSGLTGDTFTLAAQASVSAGGTNRAAINGIQIVPTSLVPEPAAMTMLLIPLALMGRRRK